VPTWKAIVSRAKAPGPPQTYAPVMMFKGARHYLHSTDVYPELIAGAAACGWRIDGAIDIRFKKPLMTQPTFHFDGAVEVAESAAAPARFGFGVGGNTVFGRIEATGMPVTGRKAYDERTLWDSARIVGRSISQSGASGYQPIEVVTALTLLLHNTLLPVTAPGRRWLLARLSLTRPLQPGDAETTIEIRHAVGRSMTRSALTTPSETLGEILFIVGQT
jgi:hypothetical protein